VSEKCFLSWDLQQTMKTSLVLMSRRVVIDAGQVKYFLFMMHFSYFYLYCLILDHLILL